MAYTPSEHFRAAADYLSTSSSLAKVSNDVKLELYALFKCITISKTPANPRPSLFDFTGRAKWDAWNALGNKTAGNDAHVLEERYLQIAQSLGWKVGVQQSSFKKNSTDVKYGESSNSSGGSAMGMAVSAMSPPLPDPKDEGTLHAYALSNDAEGLITFLNTRPDTDINLRDEYGYTPLHLAADRGNANVVEVLVTKGADPSIKDSEEFTALALAEVGSHQDVIDILRRHPSH